MRSWRSWPQWKSTAVRLLEARRGTPAVPGADRSNHRRLGCRRGAVRRQAKPRSRDRRNRQRVVGLLRRGQAGHHRSGRRAHAGEPGLGGHPFQTAQAPGPPLTIGGKPLRRLEPARLHKIIGHRDLPEHRGDKAQVAWIAADAVGRIGIRLSALAQDGLTYTVDEYRLERYGKRAVPQTRTSGRRAQHC